MPKAFTENEKELIRKRLLDQGYKQFAAYGLRKTNVGELAEAAGISKGAFYLFYPSKEALFMDVIEQVEQRFRLDLLAVVDLPGPSPRARLYAILKKAFSSLRAIPLLQFLTGTDYDLLFRRISPDKVQEHMASDLMFIDELISRCKQAGIPIKVGREEIINLLYPVVLSILHEGDFRVINLGGGIDLLLELIAAYCLGEVEIELQKPLNL